MTLEFKDEMLIPSINGDIYFKAYELENWYRRICLTAYMKEYGADWIIHAPVQIFNSVKSRAKQNEDLFYFDLGNDENLIWTATQGELMYLLLNDAVANQIKDLTGFSKSTLSQKLDELKGIRNMLAHNRALTNTAATIVTGIFTSLMQGVRHFKDQVLYSELKSGDPRSDRVFSYFEKEMEGNDWGKFQAVAFIKHDIYELASWQGTDQEDGYPSASKLLGAFRPALQNILAIAINKTGVEYTVLFPSKIDSNSLEQIIALFVRSKDIWTTTCFEEQNPKYICNPKIWFYENERPFDE